VAVCLRHRGHYHLRHFSHLLPHLNRLPASARWLSQEDKDLTIAHIKSERVGATEVLDRIDNPKVLRGIFSPATIATAFIFLLNNTTVQGIAFFAPTIAQTIYSTASIVTQQLYTVPPYVVGASVTALLPFLNRTSTAASTSPSAHRS
jgi:hypothetical protein